MNNIQKVKKEFESYLINIWYINPTRLYKVYNNKRNPTGLIKLWDEYLKFKQVTKFIIPKMSQGIE